MSQPAAVACVNCGEPILPCPDCTPYPEDSSFKGWLHAPREGKKASHYCAGYGVTSSTVAEPGAVVRE